MKMTIVLALMVAVCISCSNPDGNPFGSYEPKKQSVRVTSAMGLNSMSISDLYTATPLAPGQYTPYVTVAADEASFLQISYYKMYGSTMQTGFQYIQLSDLSKENKWTINLTGWNSYSATKD